MSEQVDVLVIGGGPVGAALALSLKDSPVSVMVLEAKAAPQRDPRILAMSYGSKLHLESIGAWAGVEDATPIETIHVSQKGGFGRTILTAQSAGVPALGYVASYQDIHHALVSKLEKGVYLEGACAAEIDLSESRGTVDFDYQGKRRQIAAKLVVMAEGGKLVEHVREIERKRHEYSQWAVIGQVSTEKPHKNRAFERFTAEGPLALLPRGEGFSMVWTAKPEEAKLLLSLEKTQFLERLQDHFGERLGKFVDAGPLTGFPLALSYAVPFVSKHLALIGNAAQTLHPVSGQGLNLGLRDVRTLAREIMEADEIGSESMLEHYRKMREIDRKGGIFFTDSLIKVFSNEIPLLSGGRGLALASLDCLPALKDAFSKTMMFGAGARSIL